MRRLQIHHLLQYLFLDTVISDFKADDDAFLPFTNLKVVTILLRTPLPFQRHKGDRIPPEINGETDFDSLSEMRKIELKTERDWVEFSFLSTKKRNPGWNMPVLKFRLVEQFACDDAVTW